MMRMRVSRTFFVLLLCCLPSLLLADEPYSSIRLAPPLSLKIDAPNTLALEVGKPLPRTPAQQRALDKRLLWGVTSVSALTLGTATLLTGVRLFNKGKNAKKIAAGDALINIGIAVDIAAIAPILLAGYWHRKI